VVEEVTSFNYLELYISYLKYTGMERKVIKCQRKSGSIKRNLKKNKTNLNEVL